MRSILIGAMALGAACSQPVATVAPSGGPATVAAAFMQAVADSNLRQMGELWGTSRGPAASTNTPQNWGQRVAVMYAYLKGGTARIVSEGDPAVSRGDRRDVLVELTRGACVKTVPFTMVRTRDGGWLVNAIDLNAAGAPGRPCEPSSIQQPPPPPPPPSDRAVIR
jgi:hypothetical protein